MKLWKVLSLPKQYEESMSLLLCRAVALVHNSLRERACKQLTRLWHISPSVKHKDSGCFCPRRKLNLTRDWLGCQETRGRSSKWPGGYQSRGEVLLIPPCLCYVCTQGGTQQRQNLWHGFLSEKELMGPSPLTTSPSQSVTSSVSSGVTSAASMNRRPHQSVSRPTDTECFE